MPSTHLPDLHTDVQAWLGITSLGRRGRLTASDRASRLSISSCPTLHLHHETNTACLPVCLHACLPACQPSRLHRQPAPVQLSRGLNWLGSRGPCSSIPGLNLDRARFQSCIPGQKTPAPPGLHNGCHDCIGSITLIEPARPSKLSETIKSPGALGPGPAGKTSRQAPPYHLTCHNSHKCHHRGQPALRG